MTTGPVFAGIEAGGTKFLCALADGDGRILAQTRIATTTPEETLGKASRFLLGAAASHGAPAALGIGSFGPLSLDPKAADFGHITSTPKPGWQGADIRGHFARALDCPVVLDTDVNCAAIGEHLLGAGQGIDDFCYVTVGTGIGVGVMIGGMPHGGANHPEGGHIPLPRMAGDKDFAGICPFHGDCAEGLASGPAIAARWGHNAEALPPDHPAWALEAGYLAALCAALSYVLRPRRIVLGGGVMEQHGMHAAVRRALADRLAGYDSALAALDMDDYIVTPGAGTAAGLTGALAAAFRAATGDWPTGWPAGDRTGP